MWNLINKMSDEITYLHVCEKAGIPLTYSVYTIHALSELCVYQTLRFGQTARLAFNHDSSLNSK